VKRLMDDASRAGREEYEEETKNLMGLEEGRS
jgi:hypothetical protein